MSGAWFLLIVTAAIAVTALSKRFDLQAPLVLVTLGSVASFVPGFPRFELEPHVILGVVLPPLLYAAAVRFSVPTFRQYLAPILRLGIFAVLASAAAVAFFGSWLVPELTLGAALVLGAVVAPTDAVSAVAVGRKLGLPKRVISVLTGEGLVNDATALTLFTVAVSSVAGTRMIIGSPLVFFGYEVVGGIAVGLALGIAAHWARTRMRDSPLETALGLILPFTAYLVAEEIVASGVLAVVAAGLYMGHRATDSSVGTRMQERSVWEGMDTLLEAFVFAYMGLQLKFVVDDVRDSGIEVHVAFLYGFAVLAVVMAVRPAWVMLHWARRAVVRRWWSQRLGRDPLTFREQIVVSWSGMRGVVTLAAAAGVPVLTASGDEFPGREMIQVIAFVVAVGTLLVQGSSIPWLIRRLGVTDPYEKLRTEEQLAVARDISVDSGDRVLAEYAAHRPADIDPDLYDTVLTRARTFLRSRQEARDVEDAAEDAGARVAVLFDEIRHATLRARREALVAARDRGDLDDEVLRDVLEGLDIEEAAAEERIDRRRREEGPQV